MLCTWRMLLGQSEIKILFDVGTFSVSFDGGKQLMVHSPVGDTLWKIVCRVDTDKLFFSNKDHREGGGLIVVLPWHSGHIGPLIFSMAKFDCFLWNAIAAWFYKSASPQHGAVVEGFPLLNDGALGCCDYPRAGEPMHRLIFLCL